MLKSSRLSPCFNNVCPVHYILSLQDTPLPHDARKLIGYEDYIRADIGEYRIIYKYENKKDRLIVVLVGKCNDDEIYRIAKRTLK